MEGELAATRARYLPRIGHVQLADNSGRHEPGTGEINYRFLLGHRDRIGYAGWVGCEYKPAAGTAAGLHWIETLTAPPAAWSQPRIQRACEETGAQVRHRFPLPNRVLRTEFLLNGELNELVDADIDWSLQPKPRAGGRRAVAVQREALRRTVSAGWKWKRPSA